MFMNVKDFAAHVNLSQRTIRRLLVSTPCLPHVRVGRKYAIPKEEGWAWIVSNLKLVSERG